MRAVVQRVKHARVVVSGQTVGEIGTGLLTLLGVAPDDTEQDVEWLIRKIVKLRIFDDLNGKMNLSLLDQGYEHLIVSQFTLLADTQKGNRPSFVRVARPEQAQKLYEKALEVSERLGVRTASGKFQAPMEIILLNDGPVTLVLESNPSQSMSPLAREQSEGAP